MTPLIPIEEYLRTSYSPDREYVDGQIVERNLGEKPHSTVQANVVGYFWARRKELGIGIYPEQRVQVKPTRFRVPDVTVAKFSEPQEAIFKTPPYLCIEILSKEDAMEDVQDKIDDYLNFGVPFIWIINPRLRKGYVVTRDGMTESKSGVLETGDPAISIPLSVVFEDI